MEKEAIKKFEDGCWSCPARTDLVMVLGLLGQGVCSESLVLTLLPKEGGCSSTQSTFCMSSPINAFPKSASLSWQNCELGLVEAG